MWNWTMRILILIFIFVLGSQTVLSAKAVKRAPSQEPMQIVCDAVQYSNDTQSEYGPKTKLKITKGNLRVQKFSGKKWIPIFDEYNSCLGNIMSTHDYASKCEIVETSNGMCPSGKETRCTNDEFKISYASCYSQIQNNEGELSCFIPGEESNASSWRLKNCLGNSN
jgi:hypothetical protein